MHDDVINYSEFARRDAHDLVAYMGDEWLERRLSPDFLDECYHYFSTFDEYHLVYAIGLGALHDSARFVPLIPPFLADPRTSVWTAAYRALHSLPSISKQTYHSIQTYATRSQDDLSDWVDELRAKVR